MSAWAWHLPVLVSQHAIDRATERVDAETLMRWEETVGGVTEGVRAEVKAGLVMGRSGDAAPDWITTDERKDRQVYVWEATGNRCWVVHLGRRSYTVITVLVRKTRVDDDYRLRQGVRRAS